MENILKPIILTLYAVFAPIIPLILFIGLAIFIDTIFGIVAAKKNGKPVRSNKLARVLTKSLLYISLVGLFYGMDYILINAVLIKYFPLEFTFTKIIGLAIISVEIHSVDEKVRDMNDNKGLKYYFKMLLSKIKLILGSIKDVKEDINEIKKED